MKASASRPQDGQRVVLPVRRLGRLGLVVLLVLVLLLTVMALASLVSHSSLAAALGVPAVLAARAVTGGHQADSRGIRISSIRCNCGLPLGCGGPHSGSIFGP
jgi:hypothetical protein